MEKEIVLTICLILCASELTSCHQQSASAWAPGRRRQYLQRISVAGLVCPGQSLFFCPGERADRCDRDTDCHRFGYKCCQQECGRKCVKGVDTEPRDGQCPTSNDRPCRLDFGGCIADSQCGDGEKCCLNTRCGYKECSAPQKSTPLTTIAKNDESVSTPEMVTNAAAVVDLICPGQTLFFCPGGIRANRCNDSSDCTLPGHLCCQQECGRECVQGVDRTPRDGQCPVPTESECIADFPGCRTDSQCGDGEKCCPTASCGYKECSAISRPQPIEVPMPQPIEVPRAQPIEVVVTTEKPKKLACRTSSLWFCPFFYRDQCNSDRECPAGQLCCQLECGRRCDKGVDTTPRDGKCPNTSANSRYSCKLDFPGCDYDAQCPNGKKCCQNQICGYKECL